MRRRNPWDQKGLTLGPASVGDAPDPFLERDLLIGGHLSELLMQAAGPKDLDVGTRGIA